MFSKKNIGVILFYGLISGLCCTATCVLLDVFKINPLGGKKEPAFVFILVAMVLAVRQIRLNNDGQLLQKNAYFSAFLVNIVASLVAMVGLWWLLEFYRPEILNEYIATTKQILIANKKQIIYNGIDEKTYLEQVAQISKTTVGALMQDDFYRKLLLSIIPCFMISLYFKRTFISIDKF